MKATIEKHVLKNGMVVLCEPMEGVESVSFDFLIPAGASKMPEGCCGAPSVISDWIFRGAGERNSRQLGDALDGLGLQRGSSISSSHAVIGASLEYENLIETLKLYSDVINSPKLEDEQFEPARKLTMDEVSGLDDDPHQKVMLILREKFYGEVLGRNTIGKKEDLEALTPARAREIIKTRFNLSDTIFALAGKYDFEAVCGEMERLFVKKGGRGAETEKAEGKREKYTHIQNEGAQVHIGMMTETIKARDKDYYNALTAVGVLSGGMSARLFTEVREKRGLCYAVGARYHGLKEAAGIACYAGTTPDKAQETVDVITGEFGRLSEGITQEELDRAKVGLKSSLIMMSESSASRATRVGSDHYILGRVRSLDEIKGKIEEVTVDSVMKFLRGNQFKDFTVVTIGPREVKVK